MEPIIDYPTLRVIWWGLLGVLLIGLAIMDGYAMGAMSLLPFAGKTDGERRALINSVAPTWEGNQVWLILGGGAIFAAWPFVYAVSFSGFYLAMFLVLAALILRPVAFKYRSKKPGTTWRRNWDWALFAGGFIPALVFGVAVGNVLSGAPFHLDSDLRTTYDGGTFMSLLRLFTPFTLLCGLTSVAMLVMQGAAFLAMKLEKGTAYDRVMTYGSVAALLTIVLFAIGYVFVRFSGLGFQVVAEVLPSGASNPTRAEVVPAAGAWLNNFGKHPWMWAGPALGFAGAALAALSLRLRLAFPAFLASSLSLAGIVSTVGLSMFPIILPSSVDSRSSLLVWTASSSHMTLGIMLLVTVVFLPIVLLYTAWVYKVLFGRVGVATVSSSPDYY
ncbi:cytochrome d ubiquinol oxidase, subunit II [Asticcacaulis biprosthecium C19]|uniref:Cytochrome d ubiquinol oxidase, subunit II n=1 Tax=Asticcacaulis biprosthecium C19 TaxID=715226 RepID=F4QTC7_9CAUL|nr:cytochrome d ubiquinol oxidase subunit II [Asticcacaulis biprosthecium]EGF89997.1 cytochrome d ubiquinol oxidase, subunit II [Asticcacaulis biprosthecium C19]